MTEPGEDRLRIPENSPTAEMTSTSGNKNSLMRSEPWKTRQKISRWDIVLSDAESTLSRSNS